MDGNELRRGEAPLTSLSRGATPPILAVRELVLAREGAELLRIDALDVAPGEIVALVGRSGCGKTTLLSCLSGQFAARAGGFTLDGAPGGDGLRSTFVSRTLQGAPLFHWLTVRGNLRLAAQVRGVEAPDFDTILERFSAGRLADRYPTTLSGGERCRASLSQALLGDPRLLLLDEPFTGLDTIVKQSVAGHLFDHARDSGAAIVFVTHDLNDAVEFSDRVVVLAGERPATIRGEFPARASGTLQRIQQTLGAAA